MLMVAVRRVAQVARESRRERETERRSQNHMAVREAERDLIAGLPAESVSAYLRIRGHRAATTIQAAWRGFACRRRMAQVFEARSRERAASVIQRAWRCVLRRRRTMSLAKEAATRDVGWMMSSVDDPSRVARLWGRVQDASTGKTKSGTDVKWGPESLDEVCERLAAAKVRSKMSEERRLRVLEDCRSLRAQLREVGDKTDAPAVTV